MIIIPEGISFVPPTPVLVKLHYPGLIEMIEREMGSPLPKKVKDAMLRLQKKEEK